MRNKFAISICALLISFVLFAGAGVTTTKSNDKVVTKNNVSEELQIPDYNGKAYAVINENIPSFTKSQKKNKSAFEKYSNLDSKGRCGVAFANICKEIMPTGKRESIGSIKPSGWHTVKYENVDGKYLYNRCHLIGWQLAGENANAKNLITGTRYLNVMGMLPFENMVDDYVEETNNHVLYRVTPKFEGNNLVATGVQIEAWSVEDKGEGICFNVFCYNIQPGIEINYLNGESHLVEDVAEVENIGREGMVWLSATGKKYHSINNCGKMNPSKARQVTEAEAISSGMDRCKKCW